MSRQGSGAGKWLARGHQLSWMRLKVSSNELAGSGVRRPRRYRDLDRGALTDFKPSGVLLPSAAISRRAAATAMDRRVETLAIERRSSQALLCPSRTWITRISVPSSEGGAKLWRSVCGLKRLWMPATSALPGTARWQLPRQIRIGATAPWKQSQPWGSINAARFSFAHHSRQQFKELRKSMACQVLAPLPCSTRISMRVRDRYRRAVGPPLRCGTSETAQARRP